MIANILKNLWYYHAFKNNFKNVYKLHTSRLFLKIVITIEYCTIYIWFIKNFIVIIWHCSSKKLINRPTKTVDTLVFQTVRLKCMYYCLIILHFLNNQNCFKHKHCFVKIGLLLCPKLIKSKTSYFLFSILIFGIIFVSWQCIKKKEILTVLYRLQRS